MCVRKKTLGLSQIRSQLSQYITGRLAPPPPPPSSCGLLLAQAITEFHYPLGDL